MTNLTAQKCEVCHTGDEKHVTDQEIETFMKDLPEWQIVNNEGIKMLRRVFEFKGYKKAVALTNKIADLANEEKHHPEITLEWGKVTVTWWTHSINGLHKNDFICAAKTDELA
ncbi:MAG: 4a-hydroxytetrahydrobiopterin dehydratase [Rickettsiales bacterium]|nr:4a-hydroxytetrahydrobiopterin dehydratase [Rickettsiales bacterium]